MTNQNKTIADLARKYVGTLTDIRTALATAAGATPELWDRSQAASDALREAVEAERRDGVALVSMSHPHDRTARPRRPYFKGATETVEIETLEKDT